MSNSSQQHSLESTKWLVLPRLEVRGMNAQPAWWCIGPPGPMAARGLAQAVAMAAFDQGVNDLKGVGLVWHHFEPRGEYLRSKPSSNFQDFFPHQHRGAALINEDDYASGSKTLSGQPSVRGDGLVTLILAIDSFAGIDLETIEHRLDTCRFAGGAIVDHKFRVPRSDHEAASRRKRLIHGEWADVLSHVRTGYAFVDRSELIAEAMAAGAADPLDAFLACTQQLGRDANAKLKTDRIKPRSTWLSPYLAGYYGLTPAIPRRMSRDGHPHAFVEPLIGLGQFLSIRGSANEPGVIPLWDYTDGSDGTYRIEEINCLGGSKPAAKAYEPRAFDTTPPKEKP